MRHPGAPVGQRTDIFVNTLRRSETGEPIDPIAAVIEAKGCWNAELFTALGTQLGPGLYGAAAGAGRDLSGRLVRSSELDPEDSRRHRVPKQTVEKSRQQLEHRRPRPPKGFASVRSSWRSRRPRLSLQESPRSMRPGRYPPPRRADGKLPRSPPACRRIGLMRAVQISPPARLRTTRRGRLSWEWRLVALVDGAFEGRRREQCAARGWPDAARTLPSEKRGRARRGDAALG